MGIPAELCLGHEDTVPLCHSKLFCKAGILLEIAGFQYKKNVCRSRDLLTEKTDLQKTGMTNFKESDILDHDPSSFDQ